MDQSYFWKATRFLATQKKITRICTTWISIPCPQQPDTCPFPRLDESSAISLGSILILFYQLYLDLPSGFLASDFPPEGPCTLSFPIRAICPAHLIILTLGTADKKHKSRTHHSNLLLACINIVRYVIPYMCCGKGKAIQLQAWTGPEGSRRLRLPDFKTIGTRKW